MSNPPKIHQSSVFHSVPPDDVSLRPSGDFLQAEASGMLHYTLQQGDDYDGAVDWFTQNPFQLTFDYCSERTVTGEKKPGNTCFGADFGEPRNAPFERRTVDPTVRVHPFYAQSPYGLVSLSVSFEGEDAPKIKNLGAEYLPDVLGKQVFQLAEAAIAFHQNQLIQDMKSLSNDSELLSQTHHQGWDKLQQDYAIYQSAYQALAALSELPGLNFASKNVLPNGSIDPVWTKLTSLATTILDKTTSDTDRSKAQIAFLGVLSNETLAENVDALKFAEPKAKEPGQKIQTAEDFQHAALRRIGMKVRPKEEHSGASLEDESVDKNVSRFSARLSSYFLHGYYDLQTPCNQLILTLESARTALADKDSPAEKIQSALQAAHSAIVQDTNNLLLLLKGTHTIERNRRIESSPRHIIGLKGPGQHSEGVPYPQQEFLSAYYGYAEGDGRLRAGVLATEALTREDAPGTLHDDRLSELSDNDKPDAGYVFFTGALAFHPGIDDKLEILGDVRLGSSFGHYTTGASALLGGKTTYSMAMDTHDTLGFDARAYLTDFFADTPVDLSEWGFQTGAFARIENPWVHWNTQLELGLAGVFPTGKVPQQKTISSRPIVADGKNATEVTTREGRFFAREGGLSLFAAIKPEYLFYPNFSVTGELGGEINSDKSNNLRLGAGLKIAY